MNRLTFKQSQVLHKSINTILVCSGGEYERESFHVNPWDRDGKITLCPSDVILDVACQIILWDKSPTSLFSQFSLPTHFLSDSILVCFIYLLI